MTTSTTEFLQEQKRLAEAATEGPWVADGHEISQHWSRPEPWLPVATNEVACMAYCYGGSARGIENEADAEFIAAVRSSVPKLIAAIEAVLSEHWAEPYAQGPDYCAGCEHRWPCDTYRAIEAALIGGEGE